MIKAFLKEGSIYSLANIATKGVSLLLIPFYTLHFSPADYGVLDYLSVFNGIFHAIVSLQIGQGIARYLGDPALSETEKKKIGSTGINVFFLLYLFSSALLFLTSTFWTSAMVDDNSISDSIFKLSTINLIVIGLTQLLGIQLRYKRKTTAFAILNIAQTLTSVLLIVIFVTFGRMGIESVFWASIVVAVAIFSLQFLIIRKDYLFYIGKKELRQILAFSTPLIPAALSLLLLDMTDRIFIARYISIEQLGIYGLGAKFPAVLTLLISGFSMALGPIVMEGYASDITKTKLNKLLNSYLLIGGVFVLILAAFSFETLIIFTNNNYYAAQSVMPLLYLISFLNGLFMFSVGLFISKKTYINAIITVTSALLNAGLNFWLVPLLGIFGAALSTLISFLLNSLLTFFCSNKYYFYSSFRKVVFAVSLLLAGTGLITGLNHINLNYFELLGAKVIFSSALIVFLAILYRRLQERRN